METAKPKVLLCEDDTNLGMVLKNYLELNDYDVTLERDGRLGLAAFRREKFDICLLDVMLPKKNGMALANQIRQKNETIPILLLTSKSMDDDKIAGFKSGADDYITKPFNMQELLLRIEVFLKHTKAKTSDVAEKFELGNMIFDYNNLLLIDGTHKQQLTQKEADLLQYLCQHANSVVKREDVLMNVWGKEDYFLGRSMDVFMTKIRKYLRDAEGVELATVHGVGFKLILAAK